MDFFLPRFFHVSHLHSHLSLQLEDKTLFHEEFIHYLSYAMIVYKREPAVENVIEFVARFAASFQSPPKTDEDGEEEEEEEEDEDEHPFLSFIFNFLLEVKIKLHMHVLNFLTHCLVYAHK